MKLGSERRRGLLVDGSREAKSALDEEGGGTVRCANECDYDSTREVTAGRQVIVHICRFNYGKCRKRENGRFGNRQHETDPEIIATRSGGVVMAAILQEQESKSWRWFYF